ncbi:MAG: ABC transporter permease [Acidobacteriia bacterium]|nr:ABC transporter permease [Terriglobia bacterium]
MAVPIIYNIRNLRLRPGATVMTVLGVALTVSIAIFIMALLSGLQQAFVTSGDPLNVLVLRKGADAELLSVIGRDAFDIMKFLPGVARDDQGEPLASGEMFVAIVLPRLDGTGEVNVSVRGLTLTGLKLHPKVRLAEGRWFSPGLREIVVSRSIRKRFAHANPGDTVQFGKGPWTVVGVFDAAGTAHESEIWADVNQMATDFDRSIFSSVLLHATDKIAADALTHRVNDDQRLKLQGMLETDYYARQTRSGAPLQFVGTLVAIIMAIGSCFAAMNTMYAAVAYRSREIATLRVLGFSRPSVLTSFVLESLLIALLGGALAVALMLPFRDLTTGTSNIVTFTEVVFQIRMTAGVMIAAMGFAAALGLFGGLAPAWHAARSNILNSLRD